MDTLSLIASIINLLIVPLGIWIIVRMDRMSERLTDKLDSLQQQVSDTKTAAANDYVRRKELPFIIESSARAGAQSAFVVHNANNG